MTGKWFRVDGVRLGWPAGQRPEAERTRAKPTIPPYVLHERRSRGGPYLRPLNKQVSLSQILHSFYNFTSNTTTIPKASGTIPRCGFHHYSPFFLSPQMPSTSCKVTTMVGPRSTFGNSSTVLLQQTHASVHSYLHLQKTKVAEAVRMESPNNSGAVAANSDRVCQIVLLLAGMNRRHSSTTSIATQ